MTRVLIVTGDPIGERMAGPAIRAVNIALELDSRGHSVRLISTASADRPGLSVPAYAVRAGDDGAMRTHERWAEAVLVQGHVLGQFPSLRSTDRVLIADVYDPMHLEMLEQGRELPPATWALRVGAARSALNDQLRRADFVLCASERQRLFYLGHLAALGRANPATYAHDPDLRRLIDLAPFGLESAAPVLRPGSAIRGVVPGIDAESKVLIWGGGVYSWFDPLTLIRAVAGLRERVPGIRLFFLGTRHPGVDEMGIVREAFDLAVELGVEGREVLFNDSWVPYDERGAYLIEADIGVSTHHVHVETTFAFRTRILDYLWAGLPMVVTEGDGFADLVADEGLGLVVPPEDVASLMRALETMLLDTAAADGFRRQVARVRERYTWTLVLEQLARFLEDPQHAADYVPGRDDMGAGGEGGRTAGLAHDLRMALHHLRHAGPRDVARRVVRRLGR